MIAQGHVPRGPVLPAERHPPRRARRCASGGTTSRCSSSTSSRQFTRTNGYAVTRISPEAMEALMRVLAGRATCASWRTSSSASWSSGRNRVIERRGPAAGDPHSTRPSTRGRSASAAGRWPTICTSGCSTSSESFWTAVYPLYMQREITQRQRARCRAQGAGGGARQLQDRGAAVQHGAARLQAVPELPEEARLPAAVQGISA